MINGINKVMIMTKSKVKDQTPFSMLQQQSHWGGMAEWLASPDWDREVVGSNPGVARSDGQ